MVIITRKCDKCGKEVTDARSIGYLAIYGYHFDICQECLGDLITEKMLKNKSTEEILRSIMDKTAGTVVPFE